MSLATQKKPARRGFVFYRSRVGSRYTLESAAYPGWFLCTSCNSGGPVEVTNETGSNKNTEFSFQTPGKTEVSQ